MLEYQGQVRRLDSDIIKCGFGRQRWQDGATFDGFWFNNEPVSIGVFTTSDGRQYEGAWQTEKLTGMIHFRPLQEQENSVEVWADGSYYHGGYLAGSKENHGVYCWADGSRYEGDWQRDEMHGHGLFFWADGRKFEGEFRQGMMHGRGIYTWKDGRRYIGEYAENKKQGQGVYTYSDGTQYHGGWDQGQQHGRGYMLQPSTGEKREGEWARGQLVSWLKS